MQKALGLFSVFILNLLLLSASAHAHFLNLPDSYRLSCLQKLNERNVRNGLYIRPNEKMPQRAKNILAHAPKGAYVSVGTERSIFGAIQSPNVTHLIFLDRTPAVCAFNNMNMVLMKLSKGHLEDYRYLRQKASLEEWKQHIDKNPALLSEIEKKFVTSEDMFEIWQFAIRSGDPVINFENPPRKNFFTEGTHYLYDDQAFQKIYHLVSNNRVDVVLIDLTEQDKMAELAKAMKEQGLHTSVLDISNAWHNIYLDSEGVYKIVDHMKKNFLLHDDSLVLGSGSMFPLIGEEDEIPNESDILFARYTAYTFEYFEEKAYPFSSQSVDGAINDKLVKKCDWYLKN